MNTKQFRADNKRKKKILFKKRHNIFVRPRKLPPHQCHHSSSSSCCFFFRVALGARRNSRWKGKSKEERMMKEGVRSQAEK
jgi:hypothetical protein